MQCVAQLRNGKHLLQPERLHESHVRRLVAATALCTSGDTGTGAGGGRRGCDGVEETPSSDSSDASTFASRFCPLFFLNSSMASLRARRERGVCCAYLNTLQPSCKVPHAAFGSQGSDRPR
jgi:hypothetical protein